MLGVHRWQSFKIQNYSTWSTNKQPCITPNIKNSTLQKIMNSVLRKFVWISPKLRVTRKRIQVTRVNFNKGKQNFVQVSRELESLLPFFICIKASYTKISINSHGVCMDIDPFSIVCSNCHQILTLVISHCSLAEDIKRISKK